MWFALLLMLVPSGTAACCAESRTGRLRESQRQLVEPTSSFLLVIEMLCMPCLFLLRVRRSN